MSIVSRQYDKKEEGTVFRHAVSGKLLCRIDAKLTRDDWMLLHGLLSLVFHAGISTGSEQRAAEIREALGYPAENEQKKT
ncbi:Uncharacterised protein [Raoultella planticola]|uniref:hypothetical protein n=1 Tax=Raoultella planticola TaxID=575 RepID=UPI0010EF739F|nr:hypothetical protein [Raoultella planticola]VTM94237.1 Uncharacterised protein [Raoultella planticola]HDG9776702.1 hypothetical protein [Raoultella planticola]